MRFKSERVRGCLMYSPYTFKRFYVAAGSVISGSELRDVPTASPRQQERQAWQELREEQA